MPTYVIVTEETVRGTYLVEAESADAARNTFERTPRRTGEQMSYDAFTIEVQDVQIVSSETTDR